MAVTGASGQFSFGPQSGKEVTATTFYRHRATDVDLSVQIDDRLGPLEVGGVPVPTFPYRAGIMVGGGAAIQPRLENSLGWLLYGALGKHTPTTIGGGIFDHKFEMAADTSYVPWMSFRKYIPPKDGNLTTDLGELYKDCKITSLGLQSGTDTPITSRVDVVGRDFALDDNANDSPSGWLYNAAFESWESIPVACQTDGYIKVGGVELPVVAAQFAWQNQPLDSKQDKVIGDHRLQDVTIISRQFTYQITVKFEDPTLYRKVLTGSGSGTLFTPTPYTDTFDIKVLSSTNMPALAEPYSLRIQGDKLVMQQQGGIRLAGGQAVMMQFQGTAIESTGNYCSFTLRNKQANYVWPV